MRESRDIQYSILIASSAERFNSIVKRSLKNFITIDIRDNLEAAKRCFLEKEYNLVVINAPLSGEMCEQFALDVAEKSRASVMLVVPEEICEDVMEYVTDYGIFVMPKPVSVARIDKGIRLLVAFQNKLLSLQKKSMSIEEKMEEIRIVSRAKLLLVEKKNMTEDEAHRYIGKMAMDRGTSRRRIAEEIVGN